MESKESFFNEIKDYYIKKLSNNFNHEYLDDLCNQLTNHFYNEYSRFGKQYPKSEKRYSSMKIKDLDHPFVLELIIEYFKEKQGVHYKKYVCVFTNMNENELLEFEKHRRDFYNMF